MNRKKKKINYPKKHYIKPKKRKYIEIPQIEDNYNEKNKSKIFFPKFKENVKDTNEIIIKNENLNSSTTKIINYQSNTININKIINIPNNEELVKGKTNNYLNNFIYHFVYNKQTIPYNYINVIDIDKDGNCYYRNISYFFTKKEIYYEYYRTLLFDYIQNNKNDLIRESPYISVGNKITKLEDYIPKIILDGTYAGDFEIANSIKLFNINIAIYSSNDKNITIIY